MMALARVAMATVACVALGFTAHAIRESQPAGQTSATAEPAPLAPLPALPEFWSAALLEAYELPLATPSRTPSHVPRDYYYALPERRVYKSYPVYHPDREPAGYMERLRAAEPEVVFDAATLRTDRPRSGTRL